MLDINGTFIAVLINFILLVLILHRYFYKPVLDAIDQRKHHVEQTLSEADVKLSAAKASAEEGLQVISAANSTAKQIVTEATAASQKIKDEMLKRAKEEIDEQMKRAGEEVDRYRQEVRQSMSDDVARLSVMIAEKVIKKNMTGEVQQSMVDDLIKSMEN
jgi:F-type H+-transporting ATPase subunit b